MNIIKHIIVNCIFWAVALAHAQDAVHNYGNIQIHETAMVGFHMDVINDGTFDENLGLVGFYNDNNPLTISGAFAPVFYDTEVAVNDGLYLETSVGILNNFNFIQGNVFTPRNRSNVFLNFADDSFYVGEGNNTKIDGYTAIANKETFTFPVGDDDRMRPLTISSESVNVLAKCAYFFVSPDNQTSFNENFNLDARDFNVAAVGNQEFWRLEGDSPSTVTLSWDDRSNIGNLGEYISDLIVVGWSKNQHKWINLGNSSLEGEFSFGSITSDTFIPNEYEIITIGGAVDLNETLTTLDLGNYYLTPNGDGTNDFLVIDGISESPNNILQIFNRYGVMVYYKENYRDEFVGLSNRNMLVKGQIGLASGVYYYIIILNDLKIKHQGYLYLSQAVKN
ncbi:gliding motility-associated C-terminal domain-containing protein [Arenibacter sp. F26102]|uniref:gliding motility-associated C-terminal domain-containing protein n=1 Tax=Arenibacter sp. F26102 TaxID=2926416 RepID=UPI001FF209BC|nr:gliding motility-associated C-terminal domain-containing protein [Arenibacter sp. F26102]MCK0144851.1 gliding motility-associated C-terminal domain-containing protein [Arenibacter sp. F26102]